MGTPKVTILLDERGEMSAVEVNGQQLTSSGVRSTTGLLVGSQDRGT